MKFINTKSGTPYMYIFLWGEPALFQSNISSQSMERIWTIYFVQELVPFLGSKNPGQIGAPLPHKAIDFQPIGI